MSEEIYRGESLSVVFRCRTRKGAAVAMAGKRVDVVMSGRDREVVARFSSAADEGLGLDVYENYVVCPLPPEVMDRLKGVYLVEIRVCDGQGVQIAQLPGVRVLDSIMGKDL